MTCLQYGVRLPYISLYTLKFTAYRLEKLFENQPGRFHKSFPGFKTVNHTMHGGHILGQGVSECPGRHHRDTKPKPHVQNV